MFVCACVSGACVQCVWEQRCGGGQRVLQLGLPAAACSVSAVPRGPGQRGGGGEQPVLLLLEGAVHGPLPQVRTCSSNVLLTPHALLLQ